jgi:hypothetical protein
MNVSSVFKSGALAAAATIAFAVFAHRVADWSQMIDSQTAAVSVPADLDTCTNALKESVQPTIRVIPQIPLGSFDDNRTKYSTVIQIINATGQPQPVAATFYKEDGTILNNATLSATTGAIIGGILPPTSVPKDGVLVISGPDTGSDGVLAWGKIASCAPLSISTFFELRDAGTNFLYSRVGVAASPANMSSFVIPRIREATAGLDVGFAVVNTAPSGTAVLKAELKDAAGHVIAARNISMSAGEHRSGFTRDLFAPLTEADGGRTYQYVKFSSTSPTFAAIALAFEGSTQTSFPADAVP